MENFLGYGLANSVYDGKRHVHMLVEHYALYQMMSKGQSIINVIKNSMQMSDIQSSATYLKNNLFGSDFLQFLNIFKSRFGLSESDMTMLLSNRNFTLHLSKSPAGYDRENNILLITDIAYIQKFFSPLNGAVYGKMIKSQMPQFLGMKGRLKESEVNRIFSTVSSKLRAGITDLSSIETAVANTIV